MKSFDQNLKQLYIGIFFSLSFFLFFFAGFPFSHEEQLQVCWEQQKKITVIITVNYWEKSLKHIRDYFEWLILPIFQLSC